MSLYSEQYRASKMVPTPSYDDLNRMFNEDRPRTPEGFLVTVDEIIDTIAFIFISPDIGDRMISSLSNSIHNLHHDSGRKFHFLLPGISKYSGDKVVSNIDGWDLYYQTRKFIEFCREFENRIPNWKYDYGIDLILIDLIGRKPDRNLDFDSAEIIKVDQAVRLGLVSSPAQLLGRVIRISSEGAIGAASMRTQLEQTYSNARQLP